VWASGYYCVGPVEARLIFRRAFYELIQQKGRNVPDILMEQACVDVQE
jgi:hypothetical protein